MIFMNGFLTTSTPGPQLSKLRLLPYPLLIADIWISVWLLPPPPTSTKKYIYFTKLNSLKFQ